MQKDKHGTTTHSEEHKDDFGPLLPSQYFSDSDVSAHTEAERSLMAAVLIDALRIYEKYVRMNRTRLKKFREVEEWFADGDTEWPFSFLNICSELELNSRTIRDVLAKVRSGDMKPLFWRKRLKISGLSPGKHREDHEGDEDNEADTEVGGEHRDHV